ncbi:hypothetical protein ABG768_010505 [Culter alburnus]|uniref:Uncharacterized protein n=1 Tax=Culter alburnus TaxID=194366 RepID=A0AAW1ZA99_CULAL
MGLDSPERDRDNLTPPPRYNQYLPSRQTAVNKLTTFTALPELPACVRQVPYGGLCCLHLTRAPGARVQLCDFWSMKCFGVMVHVCGHPSENNAFCLHGKTAKRTRATDCIEGMTSDHQLDSLRNS